MNATIPAAENLSEAEIRALRDSVYGQASGDNNWNACKDKWLTPENVAWLQLQKSG
jgi:hypothetical protein